jgi:hypothetical protein
MLGVLGAGVVGVVATQLARRRLGQPDPPLDETITHAGRQAPPPDVSAPSPTTPPAPAPPPPTTTPPMVRYQPVAGEVQVEAKTAAARVVEELTNYDLADDPAPGSRADPIARARAHAVDGLGGEAISAAVSSIVVPGASSAGEVVYPQLGGLQPHATPNRCSIMVVVEQQLVASDGTQQHLTRCLDVRLRLDAGVWRWEGLGDTSGAPVARPGVTSAVVAGVLDHDNLHLPDSARWDIHEGLVDERVLSELLVLADRAPVAVTTCRRGHPEQVFGTSRRSAHMVGRAVDVWAVGGPVVQQRGQSSLCHTLATEVYEAGRVTNFGSPWQFGPRGGRSFTDPVHHDHLHLGVS